jgi:alpha-L-fucosidase
MSLRDALMALITTVSAGGNLLLNIAPDHNGRVTPLYEERLRDIGLFVNAHSEAIFSTKPWVYLNEQGSTIW